MKLQFFLSLAEKKFWMSASKMFLKTRFHVLNCLSLVRKEMHLVGVQFQLLQLDNWANAIFFLKLDKIQVLLIIIIIIGFFPENKFGRYRDKEFATVIIRAFVRSLDSRF